MLFSSRDIDLSKTRISYPLGLAWNHLEGSLLVANTKYKEANRENERYGLWGVLRKRLGPFLLL
jgi:hypothetical protein